MYLNRWCFIFIIVVTNFQKSELNLTVLVDWCWFLLMHSSFDFIICSVCSSTLIYLIELCWCSLMFVYKCITANQHWDVWYCLKCFIFRLVWFMCMYVPFLKMMFVLLIFYALLMRRSCWTCLHMFEMIAICSHVYSSVCICTCLNMNVIVLDVVPLLNIKCLLLSFFSNVVYKYITFDNCGYCWDVWYDYSVRARSERNLETTKAIARSRHRNRELYYIALHRMAWHCMALHGIA